MRTHIAALWTVNEYKCPICGEIFYTKGLRKQHKVEMHSY